MIARTLLRNGSSCIIANRALVSVSGLRSNAHLHYRQLSFTASLNKKKNAGPQTSSKIELESEPEDLLSSLDSDFVKVIDLFNEKAKHVKSGNADLDKWQNLKIETKNKHTEPLKSLANIQLKGSGKRLLEIVAFDPKDVKHIQSSVLKEFNINAQADTKNKQALIVSLQGNDSKDEMHKQLKELHDEFRNAKHGHSLAVVRANTLGKIKKEKELTKDETRNMTSKVEKVYKDFSSKLADALRKAEGN